MNAFKKLSAKLLKDILELSSIGSGKNLFDSFFSPPHQKALIPTLGRQVFESFRPIVHCTGIDVNIIECFACYWLNAAVTVAIVVVLTALAVRFSSEAVVDISLLVEESHATYDTGGEGQIMTNKRQFMIYFDFGTLNFGRPQMIA